MKYSPAGTETIFASGLNHPACLAFDSKGNVFVTEAGNAAGNGTILKFTPGGTRSVFAPGLTTPEGLAIDSAGNLFVSEVFAGTITSGPYGLAFDSTGNLLVMDNGSPSNILLITPAGAKSTFVPNTGGFYLAFEPVLHQLLNISTRAFVQTGDGALVAGFILGGNGDANATIVARAMGPSLSAFGVPDTLKDPS